MDRWSASDVAQVAYGPAAAVPDGTTMGTGDVCAAERRARDEADLIEYAQQVAQGVPKPAPRQQRVGATAREKVANLIASGFDGETFADRLARRAGALGLVFREVTIEYKDATVTTDALVGTAALPTLYRSALSAVQKLVMPRAQKTKTLKVLTGVSGILKPGRLTILLGPPNAGKSTFLKLLAGRLRAESALHISGEVQYNGVTRDAFVLERTAAYIDQNDNHVATLAVADTLSFAFRCQSGVKTHKRTHHQFAMRDGGGASPGGAGPKPGASAAADGSGLDAAAHSSGDHGPDASRSSTDGEPDDRQVDLSFLDTGDVPKGGLTDAQFDALTRAVIGSEVKVDVVTKLLGLWHARNTIVGNAVMRGVSGGERHRVTTAEMLVGPRTILMMDEISTGLDSATLFSIIKMLANLTACFRYNTLIALLQPPPEVIDLFDDIILLTEGVLLYHGPVDGAIPFLASCGFECPPNKDRGSFMQEVTAPLGQLEFATPELRAARSLPPKEELTEVLKGTVACPYTECPVPLAEIAAKFWAENEHGRAMAAELAAGAGRQRGPPHSLVIKKYALSAWEMLRLVCGRQMRLVLNQRALLIVRTVQVIVIALAIGSLWYDLGTTAADARSYFAVVFMSILFLALGSMANVHLLLAIKPVFFKHRDNYFFSAFAYAVGIFYSNLPSTVIESVIFSIIVYWLVGFTASAGAFFTFLGSIILVIWSFSAWTRAIAAAAPSAVVSNAVGSLILLVLVLFAGFSIVRGSIPGWWIWAYYLSPLSWGLQSIVINEMTQDRWRVPSASFPSQLEGDLALATFDFRTDRAWIWWGWLYMVATVIVLTVATGAILKYAKPARSPAFVSDAEALAKYRAEAEARDEHARAALAGGKQDKAGLEFEPVTITFIDLDYFVPNPDKAVKGELQLLRSITGSVRPGMLCALMGGSGAGKTTLCDVLAGRKNVGRTAGQILVNGLPVEPRAWARRLGYVQQNDIHSPQLTVHESLIVSAKLRLGRGLSRAEVDSQVASTLQMVDLVDVMDSMVGTGNGVGLSTEQRKRLTIAVELVANPSAVFCDEPTSGLDARAAAIVIRSVKSVAESGRTVMVVVHQPSIDIFYAFDVMLLLARGGRPVFFGELGQNAQNLVGYLESIPGTLRLRPGYNPATWMLEATGGSMISAAAPPQRDFSDAYRESALCRQNRAAAEADAAAGRERRRPLTVSSRYESTFATQLVVLLRKFRTIYWRKPDYNLVRFILTVVIALVVGTTFLDVGTPSGPATVADVQNVMGLLYTSIVFVGMMNLMSAMPVVGQERAVYYRERSSGMYSAMPFAIAASSVEVPYTALQCLIYLPIVFFLAGFDNSGGWEFWYMLLMFYLTVSMYCYMGQFLAYATASQEGGVILASGLNFVFSVFNGFTRPYPAMPAGWQWLNRLVPTTWILYGLGVTQLGNNDAVFVYTDGRQSTVAQFMDDYFGYEYSFRWYCVLIVAAWVVFFRLMSAAALRFLRFQKT